MGYRRVAHRQMARGLFAASALIIVAMTVIMFDSSITFEGEGLLVKILAGIFGILAPAGLFLLWDGMRQYWLRCDQSSNAMHKASFWLMLFGLWYGALVYYALVYLPRTLREGRKTSQTEAS
jgi:hypothetical protein